MPKATTCGKYGKISSSKRRGLPASSFGLPGERKYPMPDPAHASNAKARATQEYNRGDLSKRQLKQVHRRADQVIASCKGRRKGRGGAKSRNPKFAAYRKKWQACVRKKKCPATKRVKGRYQPSDCVLKCKAAARTATR